MVSGSSANAPIVKALNVSYAGRGISLINVIIERGSPP